MNHPSPRDNDPQTSSIRRPVSITAVSQAGKYVGSVHFFQLAIRVGYVFVFFLELDFDVFLLGTRIGYLIAVNALKKATRVGGIHILSDLIDSSLVD